MKKKASVWKYLIPMMIGILVMSVAFILISYSTFRDVEIEDCEVYAQGLTDLIASEIINVDDIDGYIEQGRSYPGYDVIERKLYKLRDAYPDVVYLYVYQMREDGCHVVFDLDTDAFKSSEPGTVEEYFPAYEKYIPDLLEGKKVPSIESREKYGYVLTVLTPLYDGDGICRCYVGADCSLDRLSDYVWSIIRQIAFFFLIMALNNMVAYDSLKKAFDIREITGYIANLGWGKYIGIIIFTLIVYMIIMVAVSFFIGFITMAFSMAVSNQAFAISIFIAIIEGLFIDSYMSLFFNRVCGSVYREAIK